MSIKLPLNTKWTQPNTSDKFGSLSYTKNINLDEEGYLKLSPRMVNVFDDSANISNVADDDFNIPVAFGRKEQGQFYIATTDEPFDLTMSDVQKTIAEDTAVGNPDLTFNSHGKWWQNRFYESTATTVRYNAAGTWSSDVISGLTSGVRHYLEVFKNRKTLCVSDGNQVKQYNADEGHTENTHLILPSDFEVIGEAYNNNKLGIITRLGSDTQGQNSECFFFVWDGATATANIGVSLGSYTSMAIIPYKSSFIVIPSAGQLLYWNGGGFDELAAFPFYSSPKVWGDLLNHLSYGDNLIVDGDVIYINVGFDLSGSGRKQERSLPYNPSGVWCYDPRVGLYHRWSPSISPAYQHQIANTAVNLETNTFTTSMTIPATGNPIIQSYGAIGGLTLGTVYYVIKDSDTTFKIAASKELAEVGIAIDITSAAELNYFWAYDLVDYGISYFEKSGAVALWGNATYSYQDILSGGRYFATDLSNTEVLCTAVPFLENRGYFVTPKTFLDSVTDSYSKLYIKFRPLGADDKIVVKYKTKDIFGLPTSSPNAADDDEIIWTSSREGYTRTDLSEAAAYKASGGELELELTMGVGAGQCVQLTSLTAENGVYSFVCAESVIGASAGLKSHFSLDAWEEASTISNTNTDGYATVPITQNAKWLQLKVELRGYETTIEELQFIKTAHKPSI